MHNGDALGLCRIVIFVCEGVLVRLAPSLLIMLTNGTRLWQLLCGCAPVRTLGGFQLLIRLMLMRQDGATLCRTQRCNDGPLRLLVFIADSGARRAFCDYGDGTAGRRSLPTRQIAAIHGLCIDDCALGVEEVVAGGWHDAATAGLEEELGVNVVFDHWNNVGCRVMLMMGLNDL